MDFEWDEAKRQTNILKHGIDFVDAMGLFAGRFIETEDLRRDHGEQRHRAVGGLDDQIVQVTYTWGNARRRLISARMAGRNERRAYYASIAEAGEKDEESD